MGTRTLRVNPKREPHGYGPAEQVPGVKEGFELLFLVKPPFSTACSWGFGCRVPRVDLGLIGFRVLLSIDGPYMGLNDKTRISGYTIL